MRIKVPTGPATPSAEERALHEASGHVPYRSWCQWCIAARAADKPHLSGQQSDTDEAVPRIEFDFADLGREDQVLPIPSLNAVDVGSESLSATLCPTMAFCEYLVETILAFVEALGHNVVMLHSDQEPVLVQLLEAVQSRRVGTRDASQVFATYVEEGLNDHGFQRNAGMPCLYWGAMLEALGVHRGDDSSSAFQMTRRTISNNLCVECSR